MRVNYMYSSTEKLEERKQLIYYIKKVVDTCRNTQTLATLTGSLAEFYYFNSEYRTAINYQLCKRSRALHK